MSVGPSCKSNSGNAGSDDLARKLVFRLETHILRSNPRLEQMLWLLKNQPFELFKISFGAMAGQGRFGAQLAKAARINFQNIPVNADVVERVRTELEKDVSVELVTSLDREFAELLCAHLWRSKTPVLHCIEAGKTSDSAPREFSFRALIRSLRIHHWAKNLLVFLALILAHQFKDWHAWRQCGIAFLSFSFLASAVYLYNDLMDLEADREHQIKRHRPFASGALSLEIGLIAIPALFCAATLLASFLPHRAALILGLYLVVNLAYSQALKKILIVDVITLTCLHISRILVGAAAAGVAVSSWLTAFSCFFFFGLALLKRFAELKQSSSLDAPAGRGYHFVDQTPVFCIGLGSSLISVLVFVLYLDNPRTRHLYRHADHLWLVTLLLLYWVSRVWLLAERGQVAQDPVIFALKDKATWISVACLMVVLFLSI
jgi:4-hydroxybenzoate polyprenyltransferase